MDLLCIEDLEVLTADITDLIMSLLSFPEFHKQNTKNWFLTGSYILFRNWNKLAEMVLLLVLL